MKLLAAALVLIGCGSEVIETAPVTASGRVSCSVICDYSRADGITEIRAEVGPCDESSCSTCESCDGLLQFHAAAFSCEDGAGRDIQIRPITECE